MEHRIDFTDGTHIHVPDKENLADCDEIFDSPILFSCRTGACGTCLVKIHEGMENLPKIDEDEQEMLDLGKRGSEYRLACQLFATGPVKIEYVGR